MQEKWKWYCNSTFKDEIGYTSKPGDLVSRMIKAGKDPVKAFGLDKPAKPGVRRDDFFRKLQGFKSESDSGSIGTTKPRTRTSKRRHSLRREVIDKPRSRPDRRRLDSRVSTKESGA